MLTDCTILNESKTYEQHSSCRTAATKSSSLMSDHIPIINDADGVKQIYMQDTEGQSPVSFHEPSQSCSSDLSSQKNSVACTRLPDNEHVFTILRQMRKHEDLIRLVRPELPVKAKSDSKQQRFTCKICLRSFDKVQCLGGHMSKAHPKQSSQYAQKMIKRDGREFDRQLLKEAKVKFREVYP